MQAEEIEYKLHDYEIHIDPDNNILNSINSNCKYFTEEQFNDTFKPVNSFSLIHFNCRSLYKNFPKINDCLQNLNHKFSAIALTETWINEERGDDFYLEGYQLYHSSRSKKIRGGAALFINSDLNCKRIFIRRVFRSNKESSADSLRLMTVLRPSQCKSLG